MEPRPGRHHVAVPAARPPRGHPGEAGAGGRDGRDDSLRPRRHGRRARRGDALSAPLSPIDAAHRRRPVPRGPLSGLRSGRPFGEGADAVSDELSIPRSPVYRVPRRSGPEPLTRRLMLIAGGLTGALVLIV